MKITVDSTSTQVLVRGIACRVYKVATEGGSEALCLIPRTFDCVFARGDSLAPALGGDIGAADFLDRLKAIEDSQVNRSKLGPSPL